MRMKPPVNIGRGKGRNPAAGQHHLSLMHRVEEGSLRLTENQVDALLKYRQVINGENRGLQCVDGPHLAAMQSVYSRVFKCTSGDIEAMIQVRRDKQGTGKPINSAVISDPGISAEDVAKFFNLSDDCVAPNPDPKSGPSTELGDPDDEVTGDENV